MKFCTWHCCQTLRSDDVLLCKTHAKTDALTPKPPRSATLPSFVDERPSLPFKTMWWLPYGGY